MCACLWTQHIVHLLLKQNVCARICQPSILFIYYFYYVKFWKTLEHFLKRTTGFIGFCLLKSEYISLQLLIDKISDPEQKTDRLQQYLDDIEYQDKYIDLVRCKLYIFDEFCINGRHNINTSI